MLSEVPEPSTSPSVTSEARSSVAGSRRRCRDVALEQRREGARGPRPSGFVRSGSRCGRGAPAESAEVLGAGGERGRATVRSPRRSARRSLRRDGGDEGVDRRRERRRRCGSSPGSAAAMQLWTSGVGRGRRSDAGAGRAAASGDSSGSRQRSSLLGGAGAVDDGEGGPAPRRRGGRGRPRRRRRRRGRRRARWGGGLAEALDLAFTAARAAGL